MVSPRICLMLSMDAWEDFELHDDTWRIEADCVCAFTLVIFLTGVWACITCQWSITDYEIWDSVPLASSGSNHLWNYTNEKHFWKFHKSNTRAIFNLGDIWSMKEDDLQIQDTSATEASQKSLSTRLIDILHFAFSLLFLLPDISL